MRVATPLNRRSIGDSSGRAWRHFASFGILSFFLYGTSRSHLISDLQAVAWLGVGLAAIAFGGFALIRPGLWLRVARNTGYLWVIALIAVILACIVGNSTRSLWPWAAQVTFQMTRVLVSPFLRDVIVNPGLMLIGTQRFQVEITPECSGFEGIGLMLAFGATWLMLFRAQCRFPQAFLLLPVGAALIFLLNSVRIAALILIGNAGADRIAAGGFHSQAGWIIFNLIAVGFTVTLSRVPCLSNAGSDSPAAPSVENPIAAWLMPFIMILAAGMLSRALTADFEWLYPLRFIAAAATLVFFRRAYGRLDWRIDWFGPTIGVAVFILWIGLDRFVSPDNQAMPSTLALAAPLARNTWLTVCVAAAVVTVPIAEELAFRGFLVPEIAGGGFRVRVFARIASILMDRHIG